MLDTVVVFAEPGHHERIGMFVDEDERANDGELIPHARLAGHMFADLDAWYVGLDGFEFAAILDNVDNSLNPKLCVAMRSQQSRPYASDASKRLNRLGRWRCLGA